MSTLALIITYFYLLNNSCQDEGGRQLCDRDQAIGWALATFFRQVGLTRTANNNVLERVQSFIMKDKRSLKFPGTRRTKVKFLRVFLL